MKHTYNVDKRDGTITTRVVCAVLFVVFTFAWLYWFQADLMAVAQHGLSGGKTSYDRTVGAVICTGVLFAVQLLVSAFVRLTRRTHALTYLPSFLMLAFVSSLAHPFAWGHWLWAGPLVLVLWVAAVVVARKAMPFAASDKQPTGLFSRRMWLNLLQMGTMMAGVAWVSNTNAVDHFKARAEVALSSGRPDAALAAGCRSLETDESLTMLRVLALSLQGQLPDRLFDYAVAGTSADLLPLHLSRSRLQLLADTVVWDHLGLRPDSLLPQGSRQLTVAQYLDSLEADTAVALRPMADYRLVGQLMDRRLGDFVRDLPRYYTLEADSLPRHYREALVLYQQQVDTLFIYSDSLMVLRWRDFCAYDSICHSKTERRIRSEEDFGGTYWYYYCQ